MTTKIVAFFFIVILALVAGQGARSHTSVAQSNGGQFSYDISHRLEGYNGYAHPHGYGGFGGQNVLNPSTASRYLLGRINGHAFRVLPSSGQAVGLNNLEDIALAQSYANLAPVNFPAYEFSRQPYQLSNSQSNQYSNNNGFAYQRNYPVGVLFHREQADMNTRYGVQQRPASLGRQYEVQSRLLANPVFGQLASNQLSTVQGGRTLDYPISVQARQQELNDEYGNRLGNRYGQQTIRYSSQNLPSVAQPSSRT